MAINMNDLFQKIRNVTRDFEHEQQASGVSVAFDVAMAGQTITVQPKTDLYAPMSSMSSGGPVDLSRMGYENEGEKELFVPSAGSILPVLDEYTSDTDNMIVPPGLLTQDAPPRNGYMYDDAPGMTFQTPDDHVTWQRQQKRSRG